MYVCQQYIDCLGVGTDSVSYQTVINPSVHGGDNEIPCFLMEKNKLLVLADEEDEDLPEEEPLVEIELTPEEKEGKGNNSLYVFLYICCFWGCS